MRVGRWGALCFAFLLPAHAQVSRFCSFESPPPYCGVWVNAGQDTFDWALASPRQTHTDNTGPDGAFEGEAYLYLEGGNTDRGTWHRAGAFAALVTAEAIQMGSGGSVSFAVSLHGE
eukprot:Hpha_TRINITY_DN20399_c0_g1::TRINITY_DN20399_c0_g1_i1::g.138132::m.138132